MHQPLRPPTPPIPSHTSNRPVALRPPCIPTKMTWVRWVAASAPDGTVSQLTDAVEAYHRIGGTDVSARLAACTGLLDLCRAYRTRVNGRATRCDAAILNLELCAMKEGHRITKATEHWNTLKKFFGPAQDRLRVGNRTVLPVNKPVAGFSLTSNGVTASAESNYWLEFADPEHRSFSNLPDNVGLQLFNAWFRDDTQLNFWDWLTQEGPRRLGRQGAYDTLDKVAYIDPEQRWRYQVYPIAGKLRYRGTHNALEGGPMPPMPPPLDTGAMQTGHSGDGFGIWVCSPDGAFYTNSHEIGLFHHSSFLAGGRVTGAGEWVVRNGALRLITYKTGHYRAGPAHLIACLKILKTDGIDLREVVVLVASFEDGGEKFLVFAEDFIRVGGRVPDARNLRIAMDTAGLHADVRAIVLAKAWNTGPGRFVTATQAYPITGTVRRAGATLTTGSLSFQKAPNFVEDVFVGADGTFSVELPPANYRVYIVPQQNRLTTQQDLDAMPMYANPQQARVEYKMDNRFDVAFNEAHLVQP